MTSVTRSAARRLALVITLALLASAARAPAQDPVLPRGRAFWTGAGVALAASLALDEPMQRFVATHRSHTADELSNAVDPLGQARYLVPSLVASTVVPYVAGRHDVARSALRVAIGYAAADIAGGALRVAVARHRPDSTGDAWRFRPLHPQGEWGSMPSGHVTHAFAIAAGIADESGRPWVSRAAYGLAALVAADRVYRQRHWSSDVIVGAALGIGAARAVR
jgi:membrane-associated phospholipid phosphatase